MPCISKRILPVSRLVISTFRPSCEKVLLSSIFLIPEIDRIATGLESVNNSEQITPTYKFDVDSHPSIFRFEGSFLDLHQVLRRTPEPGKQKSLSTSPKTPTETLIPPETQTTPPQPLQRNDKFDSPASTLSNRSAKAEHYTHTFANNFLRATLLSLERRLNNRMVWYDDEMRILPLYYLSRTSLTVRSEQVMRIQLGATRVTAKSDGGLSFYPTLASAPNYPVFCIEVFYLPSFVINSNPRLGQAEEISFS